MQGLLRGNCTMEETKPWWTSKTVWASVIQIIVGIAVATGLLTQTQGTEVVSNFPELAVGLATSGLGLISFVTRVIASKQLTV